MADQTIGMMDKAYFVGRKEILDWVNSTLDLDYGKVEQTASGAVACQMVDCLFSQTLPMNKVNWEAKSEYEYINNYKLLQGAFNKLGVDKPIDVQKLCRAKYQDNLEFMQWFKAYFEMHQPRDNYDPILARSKGKGARGGGGGDAAAAEARCEALERELEEARRENADLTLTADGLEKERDFYFDKLRDIEILLQSATDAAAGDGDAEGGGSGDSGGGVAVNDAVTKEIFGILYATTDDFAAAETEEDALPVPDPVGA